MKINLEWSHKPEVGGSSPPLDTTHSKTPKIRTFREAFFGLCPKRAQNGLEGLI